MYQKNLRWCKEVFRGQNVSQRLEAIIRIHCPKRIIGTQNDITAVSFQLIWFTWAFAFSSKIIHKSSLKAYLDSLQLTNIDSKGFTWTLSQTIRVYTIRKLVLRLGLIMADLGINWGHFKVIWTHWGSKRHTRACLESLHMAYHLFKRALLCLLDWSQYDFSHSAIPKCLELKMAN